MSKHITEWLSAYLDGELQGSRFQQVEEHLAECETCKNELESLVWWLIPVGLIAVWVFISTSLLLSDIVSAADGFGLLDSRTASFVADPSEIADWTSTLGSFGVLSGNNLQWAETTESYTRNVLPPRLWQVSVAMLYITWLALWWTRHTHQRRGLSLAG
jgi:hypothetical protein